MGLKHQEVTIRIPAAGTVTDAVTWIRTYGYVAAPMLVEVALDGQVEARGGPASHLATGACLTGRITSDGAGPLLTAVVHQGPTRKGLAWFMAIPAVFLLVCCSASILFDGVSPGPLVVGIPGALALGFVAWYSIHSQGDLFELDVALITTHLERLFAEPSFDD